MTTTTAKLGLSVWTTGDAFHIADYTANFNALDAKPGIHICTSTTRPATWGANQTGMFIFETDTALVWRWSGTTWLRLWGKGFLGTASRTSAFSTTSTTPVSALSVSVTVPANAADRKLLVVVEGDNIQNTLSLSQIQIVRDGATALHTWKTQGGTSAAASDQPRSFPYTALDGPTAGAHTYAVYIGAVAGTGGTTTVNASTTQPMVISVIEV